MRIAVCALAVLALLCGGDVVVAESPPGSDDDTTQRLTLPGYAVSIEVPRDWQVDPVIGGPSSYTPHPNSPFTYRLWTGASDPSGSGSCFLKAASRLTCEAPVALDTELAGLEPEWRPSDGETIAFESDFEPWATCTRRFATDGADIIEVYCCGEAVVSNAQVPISDTLDLPAASRPERVSRQDRSLIKDASATFDVWGATVYGPALHSSKRSAKRRADDPRVAAVVEVLDRPADSIKVFEMAARFEEGAEHLVIDGIRAKDAPPEDMVDAMLAFARAEWEDTRSGDPTFETVEVGHDKATRVTFDDGAAPEYIVTRGNSAIKLRAASDEIAQGWLSGLPCHHLDARSIARDVRIENRPDR